MASKMSTTTMAKSKATLKEETVAAGTMNKVAAASKEEAVPNSEEGVVGATGKQRAPNYSRRMAKPKDDSEDKKEKKGGNERKKMTMTITPKWLAAAKEKYWHKNSALRRTHDARRANGTTFAHSLAAGCAVGLASFDRNTRQLTIKNEDREDLCVGLEIGYDSLPVMLKNADFERMRGEDGSHRISLTYKHRQDWFDPDDPSSLDKISCADKSTDVARGGYNSQYSVDELHTLAVWLQANPNRSMYHLTDDDVAKFLPGRTPGSVQGKMKAIFGKCNVANALQHENFQLILQRKKVVNNKKKATVASLELEDDSTLEEEMDDEVLNSKPAAVKEAAVKKKAVKKMAVKRKKKPTKKAKKKASGKENSFFSSAVESSAVESSDEEEDDRKPAAKKRKGKDMMAHGDESDSDYEPDSW